MQGFFSFKIKAAVSVVVIHILPTPSLLATPQHLHGTFLFFFSVQLSLSFFCRRRYQKRRILLLASSQSKQDRLFMEFCILIG